MKRVESHKCFIDEKLMNYSQDTRGSQRRPHNTQQLGRPDVVKVPAAAPIHGQHTIPCPQWATTHLGLTRRLGFSVPQRKYLRGPVEHAYVVQRPARHPHAPADSGCFPTQWLAVAALAHWWTANGTCSKLAAGSSNTTNINQGPAFRSLAVPLDWTAHLASAWHVSHGTNSPTLRVS